MGSIRLATPDDAAAMLEIYAPHVLGSATSFELELPSLVEFAQRIERFLRKAPWLVLDEAGVVSGYAYASEHRERKAYQWTVECSAYVHSDCQRRGIARALYLDLFDRLEHQGFRTVLAGITVPNLPSVRFHEAVGFQLVGIFRNVGYKLGAWRDVGWWQRSISDYPDAPPAPKRR